MISGYEGSKPCQVLITHADLPRVLAAEMPAMWRGNLTLKPSAGGEIADLSGPVRRRSTPGLAGSRASAEPQPVPRL